MNFPHLSDTQFPDVQNVNVYRFQNNFDYTRWNEKTKIKLCNVLWNSDYSDVVKFDSDRERDTWFDSLLDYYTVELQTSARIVPEGYAKLPIPYDVMARYNYLFIDMPIATSSEALLDYENPTGIRRWYFFINDIRYLSPNATQAFLLPDVWTNFQNSVDIPYMLLERGHAPVAYSDTDTYLRNPIQNNRYLLAPDVNFDNAGITRSSSYVPFGNGTKYVCFASTVTPDLLASLGTVTADSEYSPIGPITYSNDPARYGHQLIVHGFGYGNGRDYSNAKTPAAVGASDGLIANNLTVYAIAATECFNNGTFYSDLITKCPQFLRSVKACFVVDEACINLGQSYTFIGHTIYQCEGSSSRLLTKSLQKSDFSYPEELQRFAKLYTSPYAKLEITDNDGKVCDVNIEETSTLTVNAVTSVAYPYLNMRVFVDGIGGTGSRAYRWVDLNGSTANLEMSNSDWFKYCFDWKIPTFALYMDGETSYQLDTFNRNVKLGMNQKLVDYHCTMRSANTAYENVVDQSNVAYTNTENAANTARNNAQDSAYTAHVNSSNAAALSKVVNDNSANIQYENSRRMLDVNKANNDIAQDASHYIEYRNRFNSVNSSAQTIDTAYSTMLQANSAISFTTDLSVQKTASVAAKTGDNLITSGALSGMASGVLTGAGMGAAIGTVGGLPGIAVGATAGALAGVFLGVSNAGIQKDTLDYTAAITQNTDQTSATIQIATNEGSMEIGADSTVAQEIWTDDSKKIAIDTNVDASKRQIANQVIAQTICNQQSRDMALAASEDAYSTATQNATNTENTIIHTSNATYTTTDVNADRTRDNVQANAGYTREVSELNAKEILENGVLAGMAPLSDAGTNKPIACGDNTGNPDADYMRTRGIQIKVKTQSDSAIRQTGDTFARFGYALNQIWDVKNSGLKLMRYFTYWKATEIWVDDRDASNNVVNTYIRDMFMRGVTVWNDPTKVGCVNVYEN